MLQPLDGKRRLDRRRFHISAGLALGRKHGAFRQRRDDHARRSVPFIGGPVRAQAARSGCAQAHIDKQVGAHPGEGIVPDALDEEVTT